MGGSSGGGGYSTPSPQDLAKQVRQAEATQAAAEFQSELSTLLGQLLARFNERDHATAKDRLTKIKEALGEELEGSFDQLLGGSVAKHTFVDGLSDIDSLLLINDSELEGKTPQAVLAHVTKVLADKLNTEAQVSYGRMAVTAEYSDGMEIQLIPALRTSDKKLHVPNSEGEGWSKIDPQAFQQALTSRNAECGMKLVPVIKLAKAVNATLPAGQRLSGYHIESLAIKAFENYSGAKTSSTMLPVFFEKARDLVLQPITDSTGQSVHVDEYLGEANSAARLTAGHILGRIAKRMRNASGAASSDQWRALFAFED